MRLVPSAVHLAQEVGARLGACALLLGCVSPTRARRATRVERGHPALVLAAAGLTLTMLMAIATRIRIGDSLAQTLPAAVLLVVNAFVLGFAVMQS